MLNQALGSLGEKKYQRSAIITVKSLSGGVTIYSERSSLHSKAFITNACFVGSIFNPCVLKKLVILLINEKIVSSFTSLIPDLTYSLNSTGSVTSVNIGA